MKNKSPFIVIEALDAGGSQTQTDLLARRLKRERWTVHQYHFPQENQATGRVIYDKFLLNRNKRDFSRREQALLYIQDFFSRADEMNSLLEKKSKKTIVVSDRFCTSTMAYQTIGLSGRNRSAMLEWIDWLCWKGRPALPRPDIVVFLDTPVEVSLYHLKKKKKDYFESRDKLSAIRSSYLRLAHDQRWIVIDSMDEKGTQRSKQDIHSETWQHVQSLL